MKVKLQFDKRRIQEFLLFNAEKIGAGVVVFGALLILYFSLKWYWDERFTRTTDMLLAACDNARKTIDKTEPPTLDVADYVTQSKSSRVPVVEQPYDYPALWDKPMFEVPSLRGEPPLFAAKQLRGTAELGPFRVMAVHAPDARSPRAGKTARPAPAATPTLVEENRGKQWIVLTALVPVKEQEDAYIDTFSQSANVYRDAVADVPRYIGYWVERIEVTSPADAANPNWEKATKFKSDEERKKALVEWMGAQAASTALVGSMAGEIIPVDYVDPALTFPLGPLLGRHWTASVAHDPEIPVMRGMGESTDMPPDMATGPMGDRMHVRPGLGGPAVEEGPFGAEIRPGDPDRQHAPMIASDMPSYVQQRKLYKLLRFFDFNVEPGKQYMYRVRLALANPNRSPNLPASKLKDPKFAEKTHLATNWSEPSPVIAVPLDWHIFLVRVTPPTRGSVDTADVKVTAWKPDQGSEFVSKQQVSRGQLLNFQDTVKPDHPIPPATGSFAAGPSIGPSAEEGGAPMADRPPGGGAPQGADPDVGRAAAGAPRVRAVPVDFVTDMTVLDFRGGERLSHKPRSSPLTASGEILLMNADGTLTVRNELEDTIAWDRYQNPGSEPKPKPAEATGAGTAPRSTLDTASR
jgi:hypothetical protein